MRLSYFSVSDVLLRIISFYEGENLRWIWPRQAKAMNASIKRPGLVAPRMRKGKEENEQALPLDVAAQSLGMLEAGRGVVVGMEICCCDESSLSSGVGIGVGGSEGYGIGWLDGNGIGSCEGDGIGGLVGGKIGAGEGQESSAMSAQRSTLLAPPSRAL